MTRPIALTGTPGTGKSTAAASLRGLRTVEVGELAAGMGLVLPTQDGVEIDLSRLRRAAARPSSLSGVDVVVGHLAHLLPLRDVVVLRCHPVELARRLRRHGGLSPGEREANVVAEATDLILLEALAPGRKVWEIDTTRRSVRWVAREVARFARSRGPSRYGDVRWLEDTSVTDYLLDPGP